MPTSKQDVAKVNFEKEVAVNFEQLGSVATLSCTLFLAFALFVARFVQDLEPSVLLRSARLHLEQKHWLSYK